MKQGEYDGRDAVNTFKKNISGRSAALHHPSVQTVPRGDVSSEILELGVSELLSNRRASALLLSETERVGGSLRTHRKTQSNRE